MNQFTIYKQHTCFQIITPELLEYSLTVNSKSVSNGISIRLILDQELNWNGIIIFWVFQRNKEQEEEKKKNGRTTKIYKSQKIIRHHDYLPLTIGDPSSFTKVVVVNWTQNRYIIIWAKRVSPRYNLPFSVQFPNAILYLKIDLINFDFRTKSV